MSSWPRHGAQDKQKRTSRRHSAVALALRRRVVLRHGVVIILAEHLLLDGVVCRLVLQELGVHLEVVEALLDVVVLVETQVLVSDLIGLLHEIEVGHAVGELVELALAGGKELFDHKLHALVDGTLVQNAAEPIEDLVEGLGCSL